MNSDNDNFGRLGQRMNPPKESNQQFVDDTWERLLNALERYEQVAEKFRMISATRIDEHNDKDNILEGEESIKVEVHLQIKCLQRVIKPVRENTNWLVLDFLAWYGGRNGRPLGPVDIYAPCIIRCIIGENFELPKLAFHNRQYTQRDILNAAENLAVGMHKSSNIETRFLENSNLKASKTKHQRGQVEQGLRRLLLLPDPMIKNIAQHLLEQGIEESYVEQDRGIFNKLIRAIKGNDNNSSNSQLGDYNQAIKVVKLYPRERLSNFYVDENFNENSNLVSESTYYTCHHCGNPTNLKWAFAEQKRFKDDILALFDEASRVSFIEDFRENTSVFDFSCIKCHRPVRIICFIYEIRNRKLFKALRIYEIE